MEVVNNSYYIKQEYTDVEVKQEPTLIGNDEAEWENIDLKLKVEALDVQENIKYETANIKYETVEDNSKLDEIRERSTILEASSTSEEGKEVVVDEQIHTGEKTFVEEVCNNSWLIKMHQRIHGTSKRFPCDVCNKMFLDAAKLKIHLSIHTGDRPYICDVCNNKFYDNSTLKRHKRIHSGEKLYSCDLCNKSFSRNDNLKKHQRTHAIQFS